jgi:hypothetical protein
VPALVPAPAATSRCAASCVRTSNIPHLRDNEKGKTSFGVGEKYRIMLDMHRRREDGQSLSQVGDACVRRAFSRPEAFEHVRRG